MTQEQWELLQNVIQGKNTGKPPIGFIIDSPWLPGWAGISMLDYYASGPRWFQANKQAIETFPDVMFLPGFWSEYGMCSEPSAFGAKQIWDTFNLPHADRVIFGADDMKKIKKPDPRTDGLLPFILQRLSEYEPQIKAMGHEIRFAVARGPLNIASFLMGTTELMMALMLQPEETHHLLEVISAFTVDWLQLQKTMFPAIDGILVLDDLVGFVGEDECREFAVPYLRKIFNAFDASVRFFHNDAEGLISTPFLAAIGINLFNFSFHHSINEIRDLAGPDIALLGNLPPRDVLAAGTPEVVAAETRRMYNEVKDRSRVIWSCGGGMPQDVPTGNIQAFIRAVKHSIG